VRVVDLLGVEVCDWYLEELGELLGQGGEFLYAAVGVVQNRQVRGSGVWRVVGVALAELREQGPGAQHSRRDAAADVAHDDRFTKVETEHVGWIDPRVDAAEDPESMWRGKGEASGRAACGERGVAADQLVGSDRHGAGVWARSRLSELCRPLASGWSSVPLNSNLVPTAFGRNDPGKRAASAWVAFPRVQGVSGLPSTVSPLRSSRRARGSGNRCVPCAPAAERLIAVVIVPPHAS
jgi:hypothetical protein